MVSALVKLKVFFQIIIGCHGNLSKESVATNFGKICKEGDTLASYPNQENNQIYFHVQEWKSIMSNRNANSKNIVISPTKILRKKENAVKLQLNGKVFFTFFTNKHVPSIDKYCNKLNKKEKSKKVDKIEEILSTNDTMLVISLLINF